MQKYKVFEKRKDLIRLQALGHIYLYELCGVSSDTSWHLGWWGGTKLWWGHLGNDGGEGHWISSLSTQTQSLKIKLLLNNYDFGQSHWLVGRVEKSKNGFGWNGYCFLNAFWYVENGGNFFFGHRKFFDRWNFTWKLRIFSDFCRFWRFLSES